MKKPEEIKKVKDDPTCFECNHYEVCQKWSNAGYLHRDNPKKCFDFTGRSAERRKISALQTIVDEQDKVIQQLESQVPRWIPVEERMPERHGQQCVGLYSIGEYKGYLTPYIFTWHAYGNNGYVDGPHFNDEGLDGLKVHYWMPMPPLPEAPKEDAQ